MSLQQIDLYLENKLKQNKNYIVFTYYELRVKLNLSSEESLNFLHLVSTKLQNNNYKIYRTGQEYIYEGKKYKVEENQLLVAIKERKYFKQFVDRLDVNQKALDTLKENKITTLGELSKYKKSQLKDMGLLQNEINKIEVELELLGLTLKGSL